MRTSIPTIAMIFAFGAFQAMAHDEGAAAGTRRIRFEVSYADLNLNSEPDARVMLQRIERAARKACGGHASFSSVTGRLEAGFYECRDNAIRQAVEQLQAPLVSRLHREASERQTTAQHGISTVRNAKTRSLSEPLYFEE